MLFGDRRRLCSFCGKRTTRDTILLRPWLHKVRGVCWWIALLCVAAWLVLNFVRLNQETATGLMLVLLLVGVAGFSSWFILAKFRPFMGRCSSCGSIFWPDGSLARRPNLPEGSVEAGVAPKRMFRTHYRHRCPFCRRRTPTRAHVFNQTVFKRYRKLVLAEMVLWISLLFGWIPIAVLLPERMEMVVGVVAGLLFVAGLFTSVVVQHQHVERIAHLECEICHSHYALPRSSYVRLGDEVF